MELSCALHFSGTHLRIPKAAKIVSEAGFAALEISPWIPRELTCADIKTLKISLRRNKLAFSGFTAIYPPEMTLASPSAASRKRNVLYTKRLIDLAHNLGGRVLVWGSPRSRDIPRGVAFRRGYSWLVDLLKASGALADTRGVKIAIEPINRFESTIIHNAREALSLVREANRRSLGIVYDTFHTSLEEASFTDPILLAGEQLAAVHVSDCNRKIPGKGHIDFVPIFAALKKVRYSGYVTLESIVSADYRRDLVSGRRYLERLIN